MSSTGCSSAGPTPDGMSFYQDPTAPRLRPSLIEDLFALPATIKHHPLENQSTAVLAWLADRSPQFARRLAERYLGRELGADVVIGSRTQLALPQPGRRRGVPRPVARWLRRQLPAARRGQGVVGLPL